MPDIRKITVVGPNKVFDVGANCDSIEYNGWCPDSDGIESVYTSYIVKNNGKIVAEIENCPVLIEY